jgi:hypothetical protein
MKYSVREAVARAYVGWDLAQADRVIAWLDECGYAIVSKADLRDEATLIPNFKTVVTSTAPKEFRYVPDGEWW